LAQAGTTVRADGSLGAAQEAAGGVSPDKERLAAPRRVKLSVSRVDPWSAMKLSFLLSVAVGIAMVVMVATLWLILSGMGVFADMNRTVEGVLNHHQRREVRPYGLHRAGPRGLPVHRHRGH